MNASVKKLRRTTLSAVQCSFAGVPSSPFQKGAGGGRANVRAVNEGWRQLKCGTQQLRLERVLQKGMAFRWREIEEGKVWAGVVNQRMIVLKQEQDEIVYLADPKEGEVEEELREFFNLDIDANKLVECFKEEDPNFAEKQKVMTGTRVLKIDPVECLFSFICSSNNNIKRIMLMVNFLAMRYGKHVADYAGYSFYKFPSIDDLCQHATEKELRENGFGYRAPYIVGTAHAVRERGGEAWLHELRETDRSSVSSQLVELPGVGKKVASCIALFSLDKTDEIPIDTHIWKMTISRYLPNLRGKTLTDRVYDEIGDYYRQRFGEYTGWAHTILFGAQLEEFRSKSGGKGKKAVKKKAKATKDENSTSEGYIPPEPSESALKLGKMEDQEALQSECTRTSIKTEPLVVKAEAENLEFELSTTELLRSEDIERALASEETLKAEGIADKKDCQSYDLRSTFRVRKRSRGNETPKAEPL